MQLTPPSQMQKTARDYQSEIMAWAKHNFVHIDRLGLGMAEEIGEYCHDTLKFRQRIRTHALKGDEHNRLRNLNLKLKDAIGDGMVYCLCLAETHEVALSFESAEEHVHLHREQSETTLIGILMQAIGRVMILTDNLEGCDSANDWETRNLSKDIQTCFNYFATLAKSKGWEFLEDVLDPTWEVVRQRDWIKYPVSGRDE